MNKGELISAIAAKTAGEKTQAKAHLEAVLEVISETLQGGEKIALVGFGSFSVESRAARDGKNPRTGETIKIPAKKVVKFKAGSELADAVN
jgi:DNA-binding protein HU-beta